MEQGGERMSRQVQCHLITPTTTGEINIVTWVDEGLKPKAGMTVPMKGDPRVWTVKHAYSIVQEDKK
jgi:hypothetical protein